MCTLSYIPDSKGFFLVNNRDENPSRAIAFQPKEMELSGVNVLCPIDAQAQGTWIGVSEKNRLVCLMNGAFYPHERKAAYAKSRGGVALEFLVTEEVVGYFDQYDLSQIEPFTMVIIDGDTLLVYRWDAKSKYRESLDKYQAHIWSSATLYNEAVAKERVDYFNQQLSLFEQDKNKLIDWHKNKIEAAPSILLQRTMVQTVSITTINKDKNAYRLQYEDLLQNKTYTQKLLVK